jgi:hypothetical protein
LVQCAQALERGQRRLLPAADYEERLEAQIGYVYIRILTVYVAQRVPAQDQADRPDARVAGPENPNFAKKELMMGTRPFNRWVWLLPALAVFTLPGLPAVAADRMVIAEEFTSNT